MVWGQLRPPDREILANEAAVCASVMRVRHFLPSLVHVWRAMHLGAEFALPSIAHLALLILIRVALTHHWLGQHLASLDAMSDSHEAAFLPVRTYWFTPQTKRSHYPCTRAPRRGTASLAKMFTSNGCVTRLFANMRFIAPTLASCRVALLGSPDLLVGCRSVASPLEMVARYIDSAK